MPNACARRTWIKGLTAGALVSALPAARAALTIEIVGGSGREIPITVLPFGNEERHRDRVSDVVLTDLLRSGLFKEQNAGALPKIPTEPEEVNWVTVRGRGVDNLVIGNVVERSDGRLQVRFRLLDAAKQAQRSGYSYTVSASQLRAIAHKIADVIYEDLTGEPGVFSTRICYVVKVGERFELQVADSDGANANFILANPREPIISPTWSPDGSRLAYVSFERKKPVVYVHSLADGSRQVLANFDGANSAPAWSPDGQRLALTLTRDGPSQLYSIGANGAGLTRLTSSSGIDTEAAWSPDGRSILFTSDRGGSPQIYRMAATGGPAERMTFEGTYNTTARWSPDGRSFCFIQRNGGRYNVAIQEIGSRSAQLLTDGRIDSSPTFSPNGRMILYASEFNRRGILAAVSRDGRIKQRLSESTGSVREPAWGPLTKSR
ncbi:MAG: Tol-Pal system protein TolB [Burkholderiales bacterium]|nr:Tol-Pal system protein TolB [Burkholderiales bacterium]